MNKYQLIINKMIKLDTNGIHVNFDSSILSKLIEFIYEENTLNSNEVINDVFLMLAQKIYELDSKRNFYNKELYIREKSTFSTNIFGEDWLNKETDINLSSYANIMLKQGIRKEFSTRMPSNCKYIIETTISSDEYINIEDIIQQITIKDSDIKTLDIFCNLLNAVNRK